MVNSADLEVVNIRIIKDERSPMVTGVVRNNTSHEVNSAEVSYYLSNNAGSLLGTDTAAVSNVEPHGSAVFRVPLKIAGAQYVIVREVRRN